jgi:hypothetical protein
VIRETAEVVARRLGALPEGTRLLIGFDMPVVAATPLAADAPVEEEEAPAPGSIPTTRVPAGSRTCRTCWTRSPRRSTPCAARGLAACCTSTARPSRSKTWTRRRCATARRCR